MAANATKKRKSRRRVEPVMPPAEKARVALLNQDARLALWYARQLGAVEQLAHDIQRLMDERRNEDSPAYRLFGSAELSAARCMLSDLVGCIGCCSPVLSPDGQEDLDNILGEEDD
jgi:hypothetical protein